MTAADSPLSEYPPYENELARRWRTRRAPDVLDFHEGLPGYAPTRLVEAPTLAIELGVARVFVKEECSRFGLPAFKVLGASYAISRALSARLGSDDALSFETLRSHAHNVRLVAATDGNHGRAVAHVTGPPPSRVRCPSPVGQSRGGGGC